MSFFRCHPTSKINSFYHVHLHSNIRALIKIFTKLYKSIGRLVHMLLALLKNAMNKSQQLMLTRSSTIPFGINFFVSADIS